MNKLDIILTSYDGISSSTDGGVIYNTNKNMFISIKYSSFTHCSAPKSGGCILSNIVSILIKNSLFNRCSVTNPVNGNYGNVLYIAESGFLRCNQISLCLCGESSSRCGDSSIIVKGTLHKINSYNASKNYGVNGASLFSSWNRVDGSFTKFMQDFDSHDYAVFESLYEKWPCYYTNVISCTSSFYLIYSDPSYMIEFYNCLFINSMPKNNLFTHTCNFFNCYSNNGFDNYMTRTSSITAYKILFYPELTCKRIHTSCAIHNIPFITIMLSSEKRC